MYLGGNRRWVPPSIKLVGSKFHRDRSDRSLRSYLILVILTPFLKAWVHAKSQALGEKLGPLPILPFTTNFLQIKFV